MLLTIITVVYNNKEGLKKTKDSIIPLPNNDVEWLIIDGNSNDGTKDYAMSLKNNNVHIYSENDNGIFDAMNKGINLAKGKYLIFMNSGDYFNRQEFLNYKSILTDNSKDIIVLNYIPIDIKGRVGFARQLTDINQLCNYDNIPHQSTFIAKKVFEQIGLYSIQYKFVSDYDFFLRAYKSNCTFIYISNKYLSYFIQDGVSYNYGNALIIAKEYRKVQKKYCLQYSRKLQIIYHIKYFLRFLSFLDPILRKYIFQARQD